MRKIATLLVMVMVATASLTVAQAQDGQYEPQGRYGRPGQFGEINTTVNGRGRLEIGDRTESRFNSLNVALRRDGSAEISVNGNIPMTLTGRWMRNAGDVIDMEFRGWRSGINGSGRIHLRRSAWNRQVEVERVEIQGRQRREQFSLNFEAREGGRPGRPGDGRDDRFGGRMIWSGRVDALTEIHIRGEQVWLRDIDGQATMNSRYNFTNRLPQRDVAVRVNRLRGRGSIEITQQPSRFNNYTAIVRISDGSRGADNYEFELIW